MYAYTYIYVFKSKSAHIQTCVYICTHLSIDRYRYTQIYVYMYTCICVYVCLCASLSITQRKSSIGRPNVSCSQGGRLCRAVWPAWPVGRKHTALDHVDPLQQEETEWKAFITLCGLACVHRRGNLLTARKPIDRDQARTG